MNGIRAGKNVERGAAPLHTSPRQGRTRPWTRVVLGAASLAVILTSQACTPKEPSWSQPGASSMALDLDRADCRATAEALAREASALGRRPLPDTAWRVYLRCMAAKGWLADNMDAPDALSLSNTEHRGPRGAPAPIPTQASGCADAPFLAARAIRPPDGFVLMGRAHHAIGPATACSYSYHGPRGAVLRLEVQHNAGGFLAAAAPVEPGFLLVDRGRDAVGEMELAWAVAAGKRNGVDMLTFTAFALNGHGRERLAVTVAVPTARDREPVPPGLRMPHGRREAALGMASGWREWLARTLDGR